MRSSGGRALRITALSIGVTWAVFVADAGAQAPSTAAVVFSEARAAAANLPPLLAARELGMIADDEMVAAPKQGLNDYKSLYRTVSQWQTGGGSKVSKTQISVQSLEEARAIEAYAQHGKFQQALLWLKQFRAPADAGQTAGMVYSQVIVQMLSQRKLSQIGGAFQQCINEGDDFPYVGAATAIAADQIPELDRMNLASRGLSLANGARDLHGAAIFVGAVQNTFPNMDAQVESAILDLLAAAKADAAANRGRAVVDARGGSMLLSVLEQFDPEAADAAKLKYPAASSASFGGGVVYQTSPSGRVTGGTIGLSADEQIYRMAADQPERAMAEAGNLKDKNSHFAALAGIAAQLARSRPRLAAQVAAQALDLLDGSVAAAETGYAAKLAGALDVLGDLPKAQQVAGAALDAADTHAVQAEGQFDLSTPESVAQVTKGLLLPAAALSYPYAQLASRFAGLTLQHARDCECAVAKPLILAKIAEGLTPAGAKAAML